ncbi:MAG: class I SAM-dependent methyltransferase [Planctomyces sp.]|nr:class I SAM-dependent methyltransferase [Planctomyces sp.]
MTDRKTHWDSIHANKLNTEVSWYQAEPKRSIELIFEFSTPDSRVIDVGGGQSFLVDGLLDLGYRNLTVLDVAQSAVDATRSRLGERADLVRWIVADVTQVAHLDPVEVWHDRAVFHFLTEEADRRNYVNLLKRSLLPGGHAIIGTFAIGGPLRCSGLEIRQYDALTLSAELGEQFRLTDSFEEDHQTPTGKTQRFFFAIFSRM